MGRGNGNNFMFGSMPDVNRGQQTVTDKELFNDGIRKEDEVEQFFTVDSIIDAQKLLVEKDMQSVPGLLLFAVQDDLSKQQKEEFFGKLDWYKQLSVGRNYDNELLTGCSKALTQTSKTVGLQIKGMLAGEDSYLSSLPTKSRKQVNDLSEKLRGRQGELNYKTHLKAIDDLQQLINKENPASKHLLKQLQPLQEKNQKAFHSLEEVYTALQQPAPQLINDCRVAIDQLIVSGATIEALDAKSDLKAPLPIPAKVYKFYSNFIDKNYKRLYSDLL
jgi:hypothetical protein